MIDALVFSFLISIEFVFALWAFSSIFINIWKNPDKDTSKILVLIMPVFIFLLKFIYLPSIFLLFISSSNGEDYNETEYFDIVFLANKISLYVLSGWWYLNLVLPNIIALGYSLKTGLGNKRLDHSKYTNQYNFAVILPVYNEELQNLKDGINSILKMEYPHSKINLHVSFDEEKETQLYKDFVNWLTKENKYIEKSTHFYININDIDIWVHRWPHSGKRGTQGKTFKFIQEEILMDLNNLIIMLTDSDNVIEDNSFNNLSYYYNKYPKKEAFSGYMSCMSKDSFVSKLQDSEYCTYELNRFFELLLGTVNCLPGAYTTIKYSSLQMLAQEYWKVTGINNLSDYHRHSLGEDRYLTHLAHKILPKNTIGLCPVARCKTDPPRDTLTFIKQRRRWMLGAVVNEMYMITDTQIWKKYPVLLIFKIIQNSLRFTTMSQITLLYISLKLLRSTDLFTYLIFILSPFTLVWVLSLIISIRIERFKVFALWPVMMFYYTLTHILIEIYTYYTWNDKNWGTR